MIFRIVPAKRAREDAQEIADYIYSDSPDAAARWLDGFWDVIGSLQTMPLRFALIPESTLLNTLFVPALIILIESSIALMRMIKLYTSFASIMLPEHHCNRVILIKSPALPSLS